jgi:hypothetical protein
MRRINNDGVPTVYVVGWPDAGVVKVGYSAARRWRPFVARGGVIIRLEPHTNGPEAIQRETYLHTLMSAAFEPAFTEKAQALPILGTGGSGFLECYSASIEQAEAVLNGR